MREIWVWLIASAVLAAAPAPVSAKAMLSSDHVPAVVRARSIAVAGAPDPASRLQLQVVLPMRHIADLKELLHAIYNPQSALYRHYLSVAEFTKRFGPSKRDYDGAARFFESSGLSITARTPNRYLIQVEGRIVDIERVFHVKLNLYRHPTENRSFMAPDREPTLDLSIPVQQVSGLDDFESPYSKLKGLPAGNPGGRKKTGSGPHGDYIGSDFRAAYYGSGEKATLTGAGQSVGLFEFNGYVPADIALYFDTVGEPLNVPVNGISTDGTQVDCGHCADGEQVLDIEYAISMAPGLAQVQVYVGRSALAILNRMATDNTSKQLSVSWGWHKNVDGEDPIYQEMAAQGQTLLIASGDYSSLKRSGQWPEEDNNLIAVGGTDLVTAGPAGPYVSEEGWRDSGGGPSLDDRFAIEPYQLPYINKRNGGSTVLRNVPDIGANANYNMFICFKGKCNGGWGGTSFSAPMWAGFVALANEHAVRHGKPVAGFFNQALYELMRTDESVLHDPVGHRSGKFRAVKGFDLVTGLGSPVGEKTIDALIGQ